jgi:lipopolysaccharide/colanic/teichoic acid biosynthesis glycosyltransferase
VPGYYGKRAFDLAFVVVLMPLWVPVLALVALWVRAVIGSPVLFRQPRPGRGALPFVLLKFRTMREEYDATGERLPDAERLSRFGRFLRSSSLDELPELLNVLKGDMSLVGPRPLLMEYLPLYTPRQARRHEVRPGISGWAQVHGRNATTWKERLDHDLWYVDHISLPLDVRILFMTLGRVIGRKGISQKGEATMARFTGAPD